VRLLDTLPGGVLRGRLVTLPKLGEAHIPMLIVSGEDDDIVRWTAVTHGYSETQAREVLDARAKGWERDTRATFAICPHDGTAVGYISLRVTWPPRSIGEFGYWLLPSARGTGLATDAVRALRDWAFGPLELARLQACVQPDNEASQALLSRLGFTREGLLRSWDTLKGERHDEWMFSLLPSDDRL
jgi:RimJ/RimL family protein N-acetyltransferase